MVTVTMDQIIAFRNAGDIFNGANLPLKVAYKLNKIKKAVEENGEFYINKFQEIVDSYAKKDADGQLVFSEDGGQIMIQDDKIEECNKALEELQQLTVEIDNSVVTIKGSKGESEILYTPGAKNPEPLVLRLLSSLTFVDLSAICDVPAKVGTLLDSLSVITSI